VSVRSSSFVVLWRAFLAQFLASEEMSSDLQLRRSIIWVLAFLLAPSLYLTAIVLPTFEIVRLVAAARRAPQMIEEMLAQLSAIYVSYSMVTTGLLTVFVWHALNFDRRDAMVIGPLPVKGRTVLAAKVAALATFLLGASLTVNVITGVPYALITGGNDGVTAVVRQFTAYLAGTLGAAVFVFSTIIAVRGLLRLSVGPGLAGGAGAALQFVFVSAVLCIFVVPSAMGHTRSIVRAATIVDWIPTNWYIGLFERLRGVNSAETARLAQWAITAVAASIIGLVAITCMSYWRQMQAALAPHAAAVPRFQVRRSMARLIVRRDQVAQSIVDFVLSTLSRSGEHQIYIGVSAAIALGIAAAAVARQFEGVADLMRPRTAILWIPLVFGYWIALGFRASFYVPSQMRAAWAFQAHAAPLTASYWLGVRAAMIAVVLLPAIAVSSVLAAFVGWRTAAWHILVVTSVLVVFCEALSLSVNFVPYTRAYEPGHARLKTRWPLYVLGMLAVAYLPVQVELRLLNSPTALVWAIAAMAVLVAGLDLAGRRYAKRWQVDAVRSHDDPEATMSLNLGLVSAASRHR
jgi:hypothetical protein